MRPLAALTTDDVAPLRGVLFDCDDTLLDGSELGEPALAALFSLRRAGLGLFAVTGRPSGFGEVLARLLPIDGAVAENGAVAFVRDGRGLARLDEASAAEREARRARLLRGWEAISARFPEAKLADDGHLRSCDVAIDVGERTRLPEDVVDAIAAAGRALGFYVTVSSVHLHLTLDPHDKATGALAVLAETRGEDPTAARRAWAFVGDSGNDAACFAAFRATFGVANVRAAARRMSVPPRFVASRARGEGFAEIAAAILALRGAREPADR